MPQQRVLTAGGRSILPLLIAGWVVWPVLRVHCCTRGILRSCWPHTGAPGRPMGLLPLAATEACRKAQHSKQEQGRETASAEQGQQELAAGRVLQRSLLPPLLRRYATRTCRAANNTNITRHVVCVGSMINMMAPACCMKISFTITCEITSLLARQV